MTCLLTLFSLLLSVSVFWFNLYTLITLLQTSDLQKSRKCGIWYYVLYLFIYQYGWIFFAFKDEVKRAYLHLQEKYKFFFTQQQLRNLTLPMIHEVDLFQERNPRAAFDVENIIELKGFWNDVYNKTQSIVSIVINIYVCGFLVNEINKKYENEVEVDEDAYEIDEDAYERLSTLIQVFWIWYGVLCGVSIIKILK
jgi:hypothetical protein